MTGDYLTRSLRVLVIATLCSTGSVLTLWADPITVTSGHFDFGRGPAFEASFTFSGTDGFFSMRLPSRSVIFHKPAGLQAAGPGIS